MLRFFVLAIFSALFFYITHQVLRGTDFSWWINVLIAGFIATMFGMVLSLPLYFWMASRQEHKSWYELFYFYTYLSPAYINFLLFSVLIRDILALALWAFRQDYNSQQLYNPIGTAIVLGIPAAMILVGTLVIRAGVRHKKITLQFPNLPTELENFRLLHITDLHISDNLPVKFVQKLVNTANKLSVDAVVFTGDILDGAVDRHQPELNLLKTLSTRHGHFYVPGNHEYYWQAEHSIEAFRRLGFEVLINETRTLEVGQASLQISGVPDPAAHNFKFETPNFEKLKATLTPDSFKILLSHQTWLADQSEPHGFHLQLSGHTHGGQFFPWNYLIGFFQKYAKGHYQIGSMQLYVNQGAGYWGPSVRLGTYCELAEIVLTRGPK